MPRARCAIGRVRMPDAAHVEEDKSTHLHRLFPELKLPRIETNLGVHECLDVADIAVAVDAAHRAHSAHAFTAVHPANASPFEERHVAKLRVHGSAQTE